MYSRYTSCKRVLKKRTKKRQTQVKRQGSVETSRIKLEIVETSRIKLEIVETSRIKLERVETSRIKLEIVETSRIKLERVETSRKKLEINKAFSISDRENTHKGTTTTTSGTNRRKVISPKVGKQVIKYRGKTAIRRVQLVGQIVSHQIGIALKDTPNKHSSE